MKLLKSQLKKDFLADFLADKFIKMVSKKELQQMLTSLDELEKRATPSTLARDVADEIARDEGERLIDESRARIERDYSNGTEKENASD